MTTTATPTDRDRFVDLADPGERLTYWTGCLAEACQDDRKENTENREARAARRWAAEAKDMGLVSIFQQRLPDGSLAYVAERLPPAMARGRAA